MNHSLQKSLHHLTGQRDIDAVSLEVLEDLCKKYPYFPVVRLLLSKKLKTAGDDAYEKQLPETALYFSNPFWLNFQLAEVAEFDLPFATKYARTINDDTTGTTNEPAGKVAEAYIPGEEDGIVPDQFHPEQEAILEEIESGEEFTATEKFEELNEEAHDTVEVNQNNPSTISADDVSLAVPKPISISDEELVEDEKLIEEIGHPDKKLPEAFGNMLSTDTVNDTDDRITISLEDHDIFTKAMAEKKQGYSGFAPTDSDQLIPIEPYHTIDYFASQGIKLALEKNPKDKLGKQLKSFTAWLKHMKNNVPESGIETLKDNSLEQAIPGMADHSNKARDIVTETMAEVLVMQGKSEKAIQLYLKLSFLYPDKSAFFAEKISKLKGI